MKINDKKNKAIEFSREICSGNKTKLNNISMTHTQREESGCTIQNKMV